MKKGYLHLFFLLGLVTISFAQTKKDTTYKVPKSVLSFDINQYLPQITPKSPNVAAMEQFGNIAVNLNNGLADISIPIFEIKAGSLSIPIKLMYHHAGNKVSEHASWVGQGWSTSLFSVSRNVRGKPDEDSGNGGVLGQNLFNLDNYLTNISCLTEQLKTDLDLFADGKDIERDIFTVSTPTKNNSFALLPDGAFWLQSDKSKVTYTAGLQSLNLTDENGNRFAFTDKEITNSYPSAWHLTEVQGNKPIDKVIFSYQDNGNIPVFVAERTDYEVYHTNINGFDGSSINGGLVSITNADNSPTMSIRLLNEIYFPNGKIVFNTAPNRADNLGKSLSNIEIYSFNLNSNDYSLIKKFVMVQSYKDGRLFLDGVDLFDNNGTKIGSYTCTYNETALPSKDSKSKDYWGFYNGQSNSTLIPAQSFQEYERSGGPLYTYNVGGANRNPNEFYMQAGILTQLTYPTGGFTTFEYEAHRHDGGQLAGGLRIKKTVSNDGNNKTITRTYKYGSSENGDGTYRNVTPFTYSTVQYQKHPRNPFATSGSSAYLDYYYNIRIFSSSFITPQSTNEGSPVTYPIVTEYQDDGTGTNGKTVYLFDDGNGDDLVTLPSTAKNFYRSRHWSRGQLLEKTVFGSNGAKKYKQINTYSTINNGISPALGYLVGRTEVQLNFYTESNGCLQNYSLFTPIRNVFWAYGLRKPIRSEEYFYDDTDDSKYVYKKTETDFDNTYFQLKETRNYQSNGKTNIQKIRYVTDFDTYNSGSFNLYSTLYWMRENNQLNTPIEQIQLVKLPSESDNRVLDGQITDFLTSVQNGYNYVYPKEIYLFENPYFPTPVYESNYSSAYLTVGVLWKDFRYILRLQSDNYDSYGNLLSYKLTGGATTKFDYSINQFNSVFHTIINSEAKNFGGNTVLTTNFAYDLPLLGVKEITAPNGLKSTFEYDTFGRFKRAKDHNGNIIKEHDYNMGANNTFIKEYIPRVEMGSLSGGYSDYQTTTKYFDGLGRVLQNVGYVAGFNASNDIITEATTYDNLGRVEKSYVPFPNGGGGSQASLPSTVHGDSSPYSNVSEYDNSPLNRPKKSFGAGQAWRDANKFTETKYLVVPSGTITKYDLSSNGAFVNDTWSEALHKNAYISEQGKQVIEYKDNQGKLIQKDVQDGSNSYMSTHYIYDEFDRIKYIIQPESFKTPSSFTENDTYFQAGVFGYKYDKRHRIVENHVPSGGWTYVVYDKLNRVVLKQTEKQRPNNRWKFVKYDAHSREYLKGELSSSSSRQDFQNDFEGVANAFDDGSPQSFPSSAPVATNEDREIRLFDNYGFVGTEISWNNNPNYQQTVHAQYTDAKGLLTGIVARDPQNPDKVYHTAFYYDNKGRVIQSYQTHHLGGSNHYTKPVITNTQYNFVGQPLSIVVAKQRDGQATIVDKTDNEYDHVGRLTKTYHSINGTQTEISRYTYDAVGRLIQKKLRPDANFVVGGTKDYIIRPNIDGLVTQANTQDSARNYILLQPNLEIRADNITSYIAKISPNAPQGVNINGLQTIDYQYHIRNWLRGINLDSNGNPTPNASEGDLFSYKLDFETEGFYDGNIGKQTWQTTNASSSPTGVKGYSFTYDDANRFKTATFIGTNGENYGIPNIDYDKNGNIKTLQRIGKNGNSFAQIDNLTYSYSGNRLNSVTDGESGDHEVDFVPRGGNAYTYYNDGSLKTDDNKEITNIIYDTYLDKVIEIQLSEGRWIKNYYDGTGKLFKREFSTGEYWDYLMGLVLKNGQPHQMAAPEGRTVYQNNTWNYEFFYQDHLGNTRVSFSASGSNLVTNDISHYDPTGILLNGLGQVNGFENRFKWQGKESLELFGLSNIIDFEARMVDKSINRWLGVDEMANKYAMFSPYVNVLNNPLQVIDPDGRENIVISGAEYDAKGRYKFNFIEAAIKQLKEYQKQANEQTSWIVVTTGYSDKDIEKFKAVADDLGVNFVTVESKDELTNYLNSKDKSNSEVSEGRLNDKVTDLSVFSHGHKNDFSFGYRQRGDKEKQLSYGIEDINKLKSDAFKNANICLYSCNAATNLGNNASPWNSIAGVMALQLEANVIGFHGKTNYATINAGESFGDKWSRYVNGFNTNGSVSTPSRGTQTNGSTSVIYNFNGIQIKK